MNGTHPHGDLEERCSQSSFVLIEMQTGGVFQYFLSGVQFSLLVLVN